MRKEYLIVFLLFFISCKTRNKTEDKKSENKSNTEYIENKNDTSFYFRLSNAAIELTSQKVTYDPQYFNISYPNGDIPKDKGVCCDVVIRAYRKLGIDLQKKVHDDMENNFSKYPHKWNLQSPDKNIDHRRVPNLMKYFERKNAKLSITTIGEDYKVGDIICWDLGKGITHIGIVIDRKSNDNSHNLIVHNIGGGQVIADCLFRFSIIGHYRYRD